MADHESWLRPCAEFVEAVLAEVAAVLRANQEAKERATAIAADVDPIAAAGDDRVGGGR
jgi:hypothetical protein